MRLLLKPLPTVLEKSSEGAQIAISCQAQVLQESSGTEFSGDFAMVIHAAN